LENLPWIFGKFTTKIIYFEKLTILWEYFHGKRYSLIPMDIWRYYA
jgi:hypothetical protein